MKSQKEVILNAEQQAVVDAREGVYTVIASPGSGKTTVLIERHLALLLAGISSQSILNLTFTAAAAAEMSSRVGILGSESVFRTFHSFCIEILKKERDFLPFKLCETVIPIAGEEYQLLFELCRIYPAINWRILKEKITDWKCANILPPQAIEEMRHSGIEYFYALAYNDYEIKCRVNGGWLDFDSLMRETVNLLEINEEVRNRWKRKYISVDEAQDTDIVQTRLIELLFDGNLMILGDFNQCIFEWRSAAPDSLTSFVKTLPNHKVLFLGQNFRSTQKLVSFFKEILPEDHGEMSHMVSANEEGVDPVIIRYSDEKEEAEEILKQVSDPINTAILTRTNRQLFTFQKVCLRLGMKYKILGRKDYFEQNEIKRLLTLAKEVIDDPSPADSVLSGLISQYNLLHIYPHSGKPTEASPAENLSDFVKLASGKGNLRQFMEHFRKLSHARKSKKGVTLSTCHQAKGRQWDHVYVAGVSQNLLPHPQGEIGEERRIYFVACTRSAKTLHISFYGEPSEFLNLKQENLDGRIVYKS